MILENALYNADELKEAIGFTEHSFRRARKEGLRVITFCTKPYVLGSDLIKFFDQIGTAEKISGQFQELKQKVQGLQAQTQKLNEETANGILQSGS